MKFLSVVGVLAGLLALGLLISPRVIDGGGDAMAFALASGIFTIALAVYIRE
jgi:hypothetical protein